jgi:hypothetical protein
VEIRGGGELRRGLADVGHGADVRVREQAHEDLSFSRIAAACGPFAIAPDVVAVRLADEGGALGRPARGHGSPGEERGEAKRGRGAREGLRRRPLLAGRNGMGSSVLGRDEEIDGKGRDASAWRPGTLSDIF